MTNLTMADTILGRIDDAASTGNWPAALEGAERILACVAQSIVAGDFSLIDAVAADATGTASRIVLRGDVSPTPTPEAVAWLMKAAAAVAEVGRANMRRPEDGDTRARIVDRLTAAGGTGMSNTELVSACKRSPETISRMLRVLRSEGTVDFASAGRVVRNWIAGARVGEPVKAAHAATPTVGPAQDNSASGDASVEASPSVGARDIVASEGIVAIVRNEGKPAANDAASVRSFHTA